MEYKKRPSQLIIPSPFYINAPVYLAMAVLRYCSEVSIHLSPAMGKRDVTVVERLASGKADHGLPNLEIHLKDSTSARWFIDGEPQKSVAVDRLKSNPSRNSDTDRSNEQTYIINEDYQIALTAFHRLRNVQRVKVYLPENMVRDNEFPYNMETFPVQREAFETWLDADNPWNDKSIQGD
jgi:hypothetical protein